MDVNIDITVSKAAADFGLKVLAGGKAVDNVIKDVYIGDLLSWVMGRCPESAAWITIQGHVNIVAVALLTGASCIIIAESADADPDTLEKAEAEGIPVLATELTSYQIARKFMLVQA
ncbi:MAG: AraC family transcriptional regulator [Clostridiales bacterium]|jgi:predicted transcriptional regulator|nr:AraC family transcriptional regulator [Clostridiales bacterium]